MDKWSLFALICMASTFFAGTDGCASGSKSRSQENFINSIRWDNPEQDARQLLRGIDSIKGNLSSCSNYNVWTVKYSGANNDTACVTLSSSRICLGGSLYKVYVNMIEKKLIKIDEGPLPE